MREGEYGNKQLSTQRMKITITENINNKENDTFSDTGFTSHGCSLTQQSFGKSRLKIYLNKYIFKEIFIVHKAQEDC
jgi:uncharacterized iron-regulated protein